MLKDIKKKKDKNKQKEPTSIVQNFIPKKKNQNQTNVNVLCKPEEILSRKKKKKKGKNKSRKRQKVGHWMEKGNFVQLTLLPFSLPFSLHF